MQPMSTDSAAVIRGDCCGRDGPSLSRIVQLCPSRVVGSIWQTGVNFATRRLGVKLRIIDYLRAVAIC